MKVIKDNFKHFPKEVVCNKCLSVIELESGADIIKHPIIGSSLYIYDNFSKMYQWKCPLCKELNDVEL